MHHAVWWLCWGFVVAACGGKSRVPAPDAASAGSGGDTSSLGGAGGAPEVSGAGAAGAPAVSVAEELIDDGERGNDDFPPLPPMSTGFWWGQNHLGNWFVSAPDPDGYNRDADRAELIPPRGDSTFAYRVQDGGRARGVNLWAQLDHPRGASMDLGAYSGITFWAKLRGANGRLVVGMNPSVFYFDAPGSVPKVVVSVSQEWQKVELPFEAFGVEAAVAASFDFVAGEGGGDFELWIDDLAFLCRNACPTHE